MYGWSVTSTFQRARSAEQREIRRRAILDTAAAMRDAMPGAAVSLNELSRRVGLAKSNVLRYFESREAVLLELLDDFLGQWLVDVERGLDAWVRPGADVEERAGQVADVLARSLADRPVLLDLLAAQGGVLEHNVSVEGVKRHKRASLARLAAVADLLQRHLPELGDAAQSYGLMAVVSAGAVASYTPPPPVVLEALADDPDLAVFQVDVAGALRDVLGALLVGRLPRG